MHTITLTRALVHAHTHTHTHTHTILISHLLPCGFVHVTAPIRLGVQSLLDGFATFSVLSLLVGSAVLYEIIVLSVASMIFWVVLFFACLARALDAHVQSWPRNGCLLAVCTRHDSDQYGTAKTSLTPERLRELWQDGVNTLVDAAGIALVVLVNVVLTWGLHVMLEWRKRDMERREIAAEARSDLVSYDGLSYDKVAFPPPTTKMTADSTQSALPATKATAGSTQSAEPTTTVTRI
jgi:hypothetical protein